MNKGGGQSIFSKSVKYVLIQCNMCIEHLIPESLGGRLTSNFLCAPCNSKLGHNLEATAKSDTSILLAAKNLSEQIPSLARTLIESHPHIAQSERGPVKGYIRKNEFRVMSKKLDNGSLIQPTDEAIKSIGNILKKSQYEDSFIQKATKTLDEAPENRRIKIIPGRDVIKWSFHKVELDLSSAKVMDILLPVKTAYEFIACYVGTAIYDNAPQLSEIRQSLLKMERDSKAIQVERLSSNKYRPFHGICFEGNEPYTKIQIRLFGWLAFRVHFLHLSINGPRLMYTQELDTGKEWV